MNQSEAQWTKTIISNLDGLFRDNMIPCGATFCEPKFEKCSKDACVHKDLFPQDSMEIIGLVTLSILMMLCTVAGIGGGGITIPILQVFFFFEFKEATAVSGISILICSLARYIYNFK